MITKNKTIKEIIKLYDQYLKEQCSEKIKLFAEVPSVQTPYPCFEEFIFWLKKGKFFFSYHLEK